MRKLGLLIDVQWSEAAITSICSALPSLVKQLPAGATDLCYITVCNRSGQAMYVPLHIHSNLILSTDFEKTVFR